MFSSVGWGEIVVLVIAALVILGPERLPGAITWVMQSVRRVRDYATGASKDLQEQMGTDFDSIREPLQQINELRQMTPRAVITKHLFDGDSSPLDEMESSVRDSLSPLSRSGPAPSPGGGVSIEKSSTPPELNPDGGVTQVDPSRLGGEHVPPPPKAPRRHDVTDWDAT
ncbi:MAG: Sec-independent protein translocase protein TatB [Gordonia sp. (in: high G+C Gram-positive bacteria)]|uniref:Sec-independent protein translocase protein TatB n=1 Tax=Gordonia sp. (in: high G+C Gram-positive bacteria) TaxID=84139 RepID=UPI0039E5A3FC